MYFKVPWVILGNNESNRLFLDLLPCPQGSHSQPWLWIYMQCPKSRLLIPCMAYLRNFNSIVSKVAQIKAHTLNVCLFFFCPRKSNCRISGKIKRGSKLSSLDTTNLLYGTLIIGLYYTGISFPTLSRLHRKAVCSVTPSVLVTYSCTQLKGRLFEEDWEMLLLLLYPFPSVSLFFSHINCGQCSNHNQAPNIYLFASHLFICDSGKCAFIHLLLN